MKRKTILTFSLIIIISLVFSGCPIIVEPGSNQGSAVPKAPSNVIPTAISNTQINISWTVNSNNHTGFVLQYSNDEKFGEGTRALLISETIETTVDSAEVSGLHAGTYYFRVKAVNAVGSSDWSSSVSEETGAVPSGTFVINNGTSYTTEQTVTLHMNISYATEMRFSNDGGTTWSDWEQYAGTKSWNLFPGDGIKTIQAEFKSDLGVIDAKSDSIIFDTESPSIAYFRINNDAAHTSANTVTLSMSVSGASQMRFQNSGGIWSSWIDFTSSVFWNLSSTNGTKLVHAQFRDSAGLVSATNDSIILDTVPPSVVSFNINEGAAYTTTTSVTLNISTTGAVKMRFMQNGVWSSWEDYASTKSWSLLTGNGEKQVTVQLRDAAGNLSTISNDSIVLDTTDPTGSFNIVGYGGGSLWTGRVNVTLNMSVSGATQMRFKDSNSVWSAWESFNTSKSFTLQNPSENSTSTVFGEFRDAAGNVLKSNDSITYDAHRTIKITAMYLNIYEDGDPDIGSTPNPGEINFQFEAIYKNSTYKIADKNSENRPMSADSGDIFAQWAFTFYKLFVLDNSTDAFPMRLAFYLRDDDPSGNLDETASGYKDINFPNWGITPVSSISAVGAIGTHLNGSLFYKIEVID